MHKMRRQHVQDINDTLQKQTWYQHPDRYVDLFAEEEAAKAEALGMGRADPEEVEVDDIDELDAYFARLEEQREMTGAELFGGEVYNNGEWM